MKIPITKIKTTKQLVTCQLTVYHLETNPSTSLIQAIREQICSKEN